LYLGSIGAALSKNTLKGLGITHVLCVAKGLKDVWKDVKLFINNSKLIIT